MTAKNGAQVKSFQKIESIMEEDGQIAEFAYDWINSENLQAGII